MADKRPGWSTRPSARVSKVPEVTTMPSGDTKCNLNVVNNLRYQKRDRTGLLLTVKDDQGRDVPDMVDEACFIRITAFGWQAEEMSKAQVGDIISASGAIKQNDYMDEKTNTMKYGYEFRVDVFENHTTAVHRTDERHAKGERGPDPQEAVPVQRDWRDENSGTLGQRANAMRAESAVPQQSRLGANPVRTPVLSRKIPPKPVTDVEDESLPF